MLTVRSTNIFNIKKNVKTQFIIPSQNYLATNKPLFIATSANYF